MVVFVVGKSGSGKTYLCQDIVKRVLTHRKVWIINNNPEYANNIPSIKNIAVEQPGRIDWHKLAFSPHNVNIELLLLRNEMNFELDQIGDAVLKRTNMLLVIDEARLYYPQFNHSLGIERVITTGRKYGVDTVFATQISVMVNRTVDSQVSYIISFMVTRKAEIERMQIYFGDQAWELKDCVDHEFMISDFNRGVIGKGRL